MGIRFLCPQCGSELEADLRFAGHLESCPDCGQHVQVPADAIAPGVLIGGLRLQRCLGKGGMGVVYLAQQVNMNRRVAVKILSPAMASNEMFVQRFMHEALATARLEHPNIVTIHDAGTADGCHYLAMEYVDGESLDARLKREKRLPEEDALRIARQIAKALAFAWDRHRMLHRDIKPANIMQSSFGEIKLMDMGLAKSAEDPDLTATGIAMGTPLYMSPEQARGEHPLDARSDMYSLGATLYHLISGSPPFPGTSAIEIITRHALEPPPPIRDLNAGVSEPCVHLLDALLAKRREQRPATWHAVIEDIERVLDGKGPLSARPGQPSQRQRERQRADALRLAEQAANQLAYRGSTARVAKALEAEKNRRAFFILAMGTFTVAVALFSLGVHLQARRRHQAQHQAPVVATQPAVPEPAAVPVDVPPPEPSSPVVVPDPPPPVPEPVTPTLPPAAEWSTPAHLAAYALPDDTPAADLPVTRPDTGATTALIADEVFRQILDQVAAELYRGRYDGAAALWAERTRNLALDLPAERLAAVQATLAVVPTMQERVLASFVEDRGKTVTVSLRTTKITLLVQNVANGRINGVAQVEQGQFGQSFSLADLSPREILRRLGPDDDPTANFLRGLVSMPNPKPKVARDYFAASGGELAEACCRVLDEEEARRDFTAMLDELQVPASLRASDGLAEVIRRNAKDQAFQLRAQIAAKQFLDNHASTRLARQYQSVFDAIGVAHPPSAVSAPPPVEVANPPRP